MSCSSCCEGCFACLTAYLLYCCSDTHFEKVSWQKELWLIDFVLTFSLTFLKQCLKKVAKFIIEQNERVYVPRGLLIIDPVERGLRVVSTFLFYLYSIVGL